MKTIITLLALIIIMPASSYAQEVKYIDAPKFEGQMYLYGEPDKAEVDGSIQR